LTEGKFYEGMSDDDKKRITHVVKRLMDILPLIQQPMDPNVYTLVDTCINILETQKDTEVCHTWAAEDILDDEESNPIVEEAIKKLKAEQAAEKKKQAKKPKKDTKKTPKSPPSVPVDSIPSVDDLNSMFDLDTEGPDIE
jgi:hypothetical protein